jgi:hypothetical protein
MGAALERHGHGIGTAWYVCELAFKSAVWLLYLAALSQCNSKPKIIISNLLVGCNEHPTGVEQKTKWEILCSPQVRSVWSQK